MASAWCNSTTTIGSRASAVRAYLKTATLSRISPPANRRPAALAFIHSPSIAPPLGSTRNSSSERSGGGLRATVAATKAKTRARKIAGTVQGAA
jgi:hypothetical protein